MSEDKQKRGGLDRRRLLQLLAGGSSVAVAGLVGLPVGSYLLPKEYEAGENFAVFADDAVGLWEAKQVIVAGWPVLVVNTGEGYLAFSAVCTHLGCVVKWKKGRRQFFCPCHGARFDLEGEVMGGPAPSPLAKFEVDEVPGSIVVRKV